LRIVGSKRSVVVGKELEIRRWLSRSHLYSSAFVVTFEGGRVIFHGAGWGHGVGLCQIGAAVMAIRGLSAEEILKHYFQGVKIQKVY
jgi:SpoIID/LytB domain protein